MSDNSGSTGGNNVKDKIYKILEAMGIERNPKTFGGKFLKGFQLITIPLFIFILASKPYFEERNLSNKLYNERRLEALEMQKAKERSEKFDKEHPEIARELENYQKSLEQMKNNNGNK
ncbi:hypothetical protein DICPUDRAFT_157220 [Dictyostelium purpureum]|uniref:Uncharacterized protein n=1 Tax=Dictyostelium purpureum TaxID=5786 RepID=F0ZYK9_DICPU|nr:uncharacterized protein DICPUDRAFT_157220 [Dictyostelium purpureum]EGC30972.1 hypothetical protein DICPUDRAFT_157220 [Dictyostelium purpureum]|eukprot:XP_003292499.1 hypothetical protein DICPUDRAFT_157220 [Dictyostelium purpureum]